MIVGWLLRGIGGVIRMGDREGGGIGRGLDHDLDLNPDPDHLEETETEKDDDQNPAHQEETTAEDTMTDDKKITKKLHCPIKFQN